MFHCKSITLCLRKTCVKGKLELKHNLALRPIWLPSSGLEGGRWGGEITKSLGNIYSQDVPTGRPGMPLYDVLRSFLIILTEYTGL